LGFRIARGVGVAVPETLHITRLWHVAKAFCLRGERRTLQLRHVVGTLIAPSAGLNEKAFCREARATRVGFGPAVLPQSLQREIDRACVGSVITRIPKRLKKQSCLGAAQLTAEADERLEAGPAGRAC